MEDVVRSLLEYVAKQKVFRVEYLTSSALYHPVDTRDCISNLSVLTACRVTYQPNSENGWIDCANADARPKSHSALNKLGASLPST